MAPTSEAAAERERLSDRERVILEHLEQAQNPDVTLTGYAAAYGLDVNDL